MDNARAKRSRLSDLGIGYLAELHFGSMPRLRRRACLGFLWNIECNGALVNRLVVGVNQFNLHCVPAGRQAPQDERSATRVRPVPRRLVDGHMNVAHARRDVQSSGPNTGAMRMFSAQYEITTTPREASGWASGASMTIFAAALSR